MLNVQKALQKVSAKKDKRQALIFQYITTKKQKSTKYRLLEFYLVKYYKNKMRKELAAQNDLMRY